MCEIIPESLGECQGFQDLEPVFTPQMAKFECENRFLIKKTKKR